MGGGDSTNWGKGGANCTIVLKSNRKATKFMFPGLRLLCHKLNQTVVPYPKLKFIRNPNTFSTNLQSLGE